MRIGIIGGGSVAQALGRLLAAGGHEVVLGVRSGAPEDLPIASVEEAAVQGEAVLLGIPFSAMSEALPGLAGAVDGKIVIDASNPLNADWSPLLLGEENSAGEEVARMLPGARVVKAFNTVFADAMRPDRLEQGGGRITAFVASDDRDAAEEVERLAADAGFVPLYAGALSSARWLEAMAHLNIRLAVPLGGGTNGAFLYDRG
jgi:hypothetical protein